MKTLITYCYYERDSRSMDSLLFFLKNGIIDKEEYKYYIVVNGECSLDTSNFNYKNTTYIKRENIGFDFGAWGFSLGQNNIDQYEKFIFINSTCIGPFIPRYTKKYDWVNLFTSPLGGKIKLCGPTINYTYRDRILPHIQSFAFSTDLEGIKILKENNIFCVHEEDDKEHLISNNEIRMSTVLIERGFKLYAFQYSEESKHKVLHSDIHFEGSYFGDTLNPIEVMFIKNNRIKNKTLENYTNFKNIGG